MPAGQCNKPDSRPRCWRAVVSYTRTLQFTEWSICCKIIVLPTAVASADAAAINNEATWVASGARGVFLDFSSNLEF